MIELPALHSQDLTPTRDFLQAVALVLGKFQQVVLPPDPHDWQRGLVVTDHGLATQPLSIAGQTYQALLDLRQGRLEIGSATWPLQDYDAAELLENLQVWLTSQGVETVIERPDIQAAGATYDQPTAASLANVLSWLSQQFNDTKARLRTGMTSPVLLYPHHFDLSLVWFPAADETQFSLGFSTGDETLSEPYLYLTAYPEPVVLADTPLPAGAKHQTSGFDGIVLPYAVLQASSDLAQLFADYSALLLTAATV